MFFHYYLNYLLSNVHPQVKCKSLSCAFGSGKSNGYLRTKIHLLLRSILMKSVFGYIPD